MKVIPELTEKQRERFFSKVYREDDEQCWLWLGGLNNGGYGVMGIKRKIHLVHRLSYAMHNGKVPDGKCVLHTCHTKECVNPHHLVVGTRVENNRQTAEEGRLGNAKLNRGTVGYIRFIHELFGWDELPKMFVARRLATIFPISHTSMYNLLRNATWKWVTVSREEKEEYAAHLYSDSDLIPSYLKLMGSDVTFWRRDEQQFSV